MDNFFRYNNEFKGSWKDGGTPDTIKGSWGLISWLGSVVS